MAYHFSANQFDDKYSPTKLGNWEYPKWYPERPRQRFKSTKIIADDQGRLLDGIKRENAWGNYVGTWDLPRRITRDYVQKLNAPPERLVKLWGKKKQTAENDKTQQPADDESVNTTDESCCKICKKKLEECTCGKATQSKSSLSDSDEVEKCGDPLLPALNYSSPAQKCFERRNKSSSALDLRPRSTKLEPLLSLKEKRNSLNDLRAGQLDEKIKDILESVKDKDNSAKGPSELCQEVKAFPRHTREKLPEFLGPPSKDSYVASGSPSKCLNEFLDKYEYVDDEVNANEVDKPELQQVHKFEPLPEESKMKEEKSPSGPKQFEMQIAKRFHDENLKHKPLPDVIDDPVFKAVNSSRHPQLVGSLEGNQGMPSAIGWKYYSMPGPTECSKLKVFRPKTAVDKVKHSGEERPKTTLPKGHSAKRFLPIDLAICWDLKPDDPSDEPKKSPHIDGSNGSIAPAVFTMIPPRDEADGEVVPGSCQAVAEKVPKGIDSDNLANLPSQVTGKGPSPPSGPINKTAIMTCIRPTGKQKSQSCSPASTNSISTCAAEYARKNPKTAWSNVDTSKALSNKLYHLQQKNKRQTEGGQIKESQWDSFQTNGKKHHQSTPNLNLSCEGSKCGTEKSSSPGSAKVKGSYKNDHSSVQSSQDSNEKSRTSKKGRNCAACENPNLNFEGSHEKNEFKSAFKAGVPKSESSNSGSMAAGKSYKAPKMRLPYAKKSYSIGTLIPPFSFWPDNSGQDYPEHWRLASVYQHSYKPVATRKRPLLASVFQ